MDILASAVLSGLLLVGLGGSLPLTKGVYVEVNTPCRAAPMSARSWFDGGYVIQAPHAQCQVRGVTRSGADSYSIRLNCADASGTTMSFQLLDRIRIISPTEYQLSNRYGRFVARWCRD